MYDHILVSNRIPFIYEILIILRILDCVILICYQIQYRSLIWHIKPKYTSACACVKPTLMKYFISNSHAHNEFTSRLLGERQPTPFMSWYLHTPHALTHRDRIWVESVATKYIPPKFTETWWRRQMKTFFRVTGPCGHRWIPLTKASDAELWCFLSSAPE